jgi:aspartate aminotransferase
MVQPKSAGRRLSGRIQAITASMTIRMEERAKALAAQGIDVISLVGGEPDFDTPEAVKEAATRALREGFTKYTASAGIAELREAIAETLREQGVSYAAQEIVVSNGAKQALFNAIAAVCESGDEVIIPSPCWVSFTEQIKIAGGIPILVPVNETAGCVPDPARLAAAVTPRTRAIVLNSPNNPTGAVYPRDVLSAVADVALRHDLYLIVDEVYEALTYDGAVHYRMPAIRPDVRHLTLLVNSMSKTFAMTGWRIGSLAGPRDVIEGIDRLQGHVTGNVNSIAQRAALFALREHVDCSGMVREYDQRRRRMVAALNRIPGFTCPMPRGAFYAFPDVRAVLEGGSPKGGPRDSAALAEHWLEAAHVAVVPGDAFFGPGHVRFSYATSMATIEEGLSRIKRVTENMR